MTLALQTAMKKAGYETLAGLAQRVRELWEQLEPGAPKPTVASIATKLGLFINKDDDRWLSGQRMAARSLAEALHIDVQDLGLQSLRTREEFTFAFDGFPEEPPLDIRKEAPCTALHPEWWEADALVSWIGRRAWFEIPPGGGRTLLARWHRRSAALHVIEARHLADAIEAIPADSRPVFLSIDEPDVERDAGACDQLLLRADQHILVCAPFPHPLGPLAEGLIRGARNNGKFGWTGQGFLSNEPPLPRYQERSYLWRPASQLPPDWRAKFIGWFLDRRGIGTDQATRARLASDIDAFDPENTVIQTPGDLLPFLSVALRERGVRNLDPIAFVERWIRQRPVADSLSKADAQWLKGEAPPLVRRLAIRAFADTGLRWPPQLTREEWLQLAPQEFAPDVLKSSIQDVAKVKDARERERRAQELLSRVPAETARIALLRLEEHRVLRPVAGARLALRPEWLPILLAASEVRRTLTSRDFETWGKWAGDDARRGFVDAALARLSDAALAAVIRAVVEQQQPEKFGWACAVEALFSAVGLRLVERECKIPTDLLHRLWEAQRTLLVPYFYKGLPGPTTRNFGTLPPNSHNTWIADGWSWSLRVPSPPTLPPAELAWVFPGWLPHKLGDEDVPHSVDWGWRHEPIDWRLEHLLPEVLRTTANTDVPDYSTGHFSFALDYLPVAFDRGWDVEQHPVFCEQVWSRMESPERVRDVLGRLPEEKREALLAKVVNGALRSRIQIAPHGPVAGPELTPFQRDLVGKYLSEAAVYDAAARLAAKHHDNHVLQLPDPQRWPERLWLAAMKGLVDGGTKWLRSQGLLSTHSRIRWPPSSAPLIEELLEDASFPAEAIRFLWQVAPDRALALAREHWPHGKEAGNWLFQGREARLAEIVEIIETSPLPAAPGESLHLLMLLKDQAGPLTERLFVQLQRFRLAARETA